MTSEVGECPDRFLLLRTAADVTEARRSGRVAIGFSFEGGEPLGEDLSLLRTVASGSWGGRCLRMADTSWGTGTTKGATAPPEGADIGHPVTA
jgi:microsomal dipeptidase-like Zn-dependent dipeptidase